MVKYVIFCFDVLVLKTIRGFAPNAAVVAKKT